LLSECVAAYALAVVVGCGGTGQMATSTNPPTSSTPAPTSTTKPILRGLVTQGPGTTSTPPANDFEELNAHPGVYSAAVIQLYWSQLEPSQGVFDDTSLTTALAGLAAYNAKYPSTPVVGKLRIFMGLGTPAWVISATGPVTLTDSSGDSITVGEFWTPAYDTLWQALQQHLASEYDNSPIIAEVAITSCSSLTGEPFILPQTKTAIAALHQAGYTDALGMACLTNAPNDFAAWKNTPLDYTFNSFTQTDTGYGVSNTAFPVQEMQTFRTALGTRGVVANHGLQPEPPSNASPIYTEFQALYTAAVADGTISPLEFQTLSPTVDWTSTIALGLTFHPTEIEIWDTVAAGGQAPLTQEQLEGWAASLQ
jgi:hypothetical protein